jgi:hypothetical protein
MDYGWMRYDTIAYKVYNVLYVSKLGNGYGSYSTVTQKRNLSFDEVKLP